MSQAAQSADSPDVESPYVTDRDWWYDAQDDPRESSDPDPDGNSKPTPVSGVTRAEFVAHQILKETAELLDPISLHEEPTAADLHIEGERIPVTDPIEVVPKRREPRDDGDRGEDYGAYPHRWRRSEKYGYLCRGPVIANRPAEELYQIVKTVIELSNRNVSEDEYDAILELVTAMKRDGPVPHDVTIMAEVVRCLEDPNWD